MPSIATNRMAFLTWTGLDLSTATGIKWILLKNTHVNSKDDNFIGDVNADECNATNYTGGFGGAGRKASAGKTVTEDDTNDRAVWDATDPATWVALGGAANNTLRYLAVGREITVDTDSPLLCVLDLGQDYNTNGGDFTVAFNATGIATQST